MIAPLECVRLFQNHFCGLISEYDQKIHHRRTYLHLISCQSFLKKKKKRNIINIIKENSLFIVFSPKIKNLRFSSAISKSKRDSFNFYSNASFLLFFPSSNPKLLASMSCNDYNSFSIPSTFFFFISLWSIF